MTPNQFEVGEAIIPEGVNDLCLTFNLAQQMLTHERYVTHNEEMLAYLKDYGLNSDALNMGVALHDVVEHRLYSDDLAERKDAQAAIGEFYDSNIENWPNFIYGLGYAISAKRWEDKVAESWRESATEKLLGFQSDPDSALKFNIHELEVIQCSIEKSQEIENFDNDVVRAVLKKAKLFDLDVPSINMALDDFDVEGLIIKGVELLDNLKNPNQDKPASEWRDCIEVINCYSPALELCGFDDLASQLRGKALEFFNEHDSVIGQRAVEQNKLSESHFFKIANFMDGRIKGLYNHDKLKGLPDLAERSQRRARVKSTGSLMEKLATEKYAGKGSIAPDGIGFKLIVPDSIDEAGRLDDLREVIEELLIGPSMERNFSIEAKHPRGDDPYEHRKKDNGYESRHLAFVCHMMDGSGDSIPFEVQLLSETQETNNKYSEASHILFKANLGEEPDKETLGHLSQIRDRADYIMDASNLPSFHPNTWSELLRIFPELKTPLHEIYSVFSVDEAQVLGPMELGKLGFDLEHESDEKTFIPAVNLSKEQFLNCLILLDSSLAGNSLIQKALDFLEEKRSQMPTRQNGNNTIEGHLLPTVLHDALLATVSGEAWSRKDNPDFLANKIVGDLLHDIIEDTDTTYLDVRELFGEDIASFVNGISKKPKKENTTKKGRRDIYKKQLASNPHVLAGKCADRCHNHTSDLVKMANGGIKVDEENYIIEYFEETKEDLLELFIEHLPPAYIRSIDMIARLNEQLMYTHKHPLPKN